MKLIHSPIENYRFDVPVGGFSLPLEWHNHRCAVPNWSVDSVLQWGHNLDMIGDLDITPPKSMLITRGGGLGDILLLTPLIRYWAKRGVMVDVECDNRNLAILEQNPYIRSLWEMDSVDRANYDAVIPLNWFVEHMDNVGSHLHRSVAFAHYCDVELNPRLLSDIHLDLVLTEDEQAYGKERLCEAVTDDRPKWVSYVPSTADSPAREWIPATQRLVIDAILNHGYHIVMLGGKARPDIVDGERDGLLNLLGKTSIREMAAIIAASDVLIAPDTGSFHIAQALDKPILTPFGPFPFKERQTAPNVVQIGSPMDCPRVPCRSYRCWMTNGTQQESPCLRTSTDRVLEELEKLFN